jgi:small subunit ribosomal protein S6
MRHYETAFLITPKLEEEETEKLIEKMAEVVKKKKGKMVNIEKWGKRRLAYPIDKLDEAVYVFFHYEGEPDIPLELQRRFRQTETIIRYLTLKKESQVQPRKKTKGGKQERPIAAGTKRKTDDEIAAAPKEEEPKETRPAEERPDKKTETLPEPAERKNEEQAVEIPETEESPEADETPEEK